MGRRRQVLRETRRNEVGMPLLQLQRLEHRPGLRGSTSAGKPARVWGRGWVSTLGRASCSSCMCACTSLTERSSWLTDACRGTPG